MNFDASKLPPNHVLVIFGAGISPDAKGPALLSFEKDLRARGNNAEVFLETMRDQNKLRRDLTKDDTI